MRLPDVEAVLPSPDCQANLLQAWQRAAEGAGVAYRVRNSGESGPVMVSHDPPTETVWTLVTHPRPDGALTVRPCVDPVAIPTTDIDHGLRERICGEYAPDPATVHEKIHAVLAEMIAEHGREAIVRGSTPLTEGGREAGELWMVDAETAELVCRVFESEMDSFDDDSDALPAPEVTIIDTRRGDEDEGRSSL